MSKSITWVHVLHIDKIYNISVTVKLSVTVISVLHVKKDIVLLLYMNTFSSLLQNILYMNNCITSVLTMKKKYISVLDLQNYFIRQVLIRTKGITAVLQLTPLC